MTRARKFSPQAVAIVLALADGKASWSHGYDLCRRLDLKAGTVYPILIRLAERGQVETAWETDPPAGRPPRHLYRLSDAGAELAADLRRAAVAEVPPSRPADARRLARGEAS